jgi:hypothetical protein
MEPLEPSAPFESLFVNLEIPGPASGAGSDSESSSIGFGSSQTNAVCGRALEFAQPTLVGWLKAVEFLDIPSAPAFELLRPPQILAIRA